MLTKSMHQIVGIEFRNEKTFLPKGALLPCNPRQGALPPDHHQGASHLGPPSLVNNRDGLYCVFWAYV